MYSIPEIINLLYPKKSQEEVLALAEQCYQGTMEYYAFSWQKIKKEDLAKEEVKHNLIRTVMQTELAFDGAVNEIMLSLEEWSKGAMVFFDFLGEEDDNFYQNLYPLLGWMNFKNIGFKKKLFLLDARFLLWACANDLPIYILVQEYFASNIYIAGMKEDAKMFMWAMENNKTQLGDEKKIRKPVGEWLAFFNNFQPLTVENKIEEFFENSMEAKRLDDIDQEVLEKIFTLYYGFQGGFIWREIDYSVAPGVERKPPANSKVEDYYLHMLNETKEDEFMIWLKDAKNVAEWLSITNKSPDFIRDLLYILVNKVDLQNSDHANLVMGFIDELKKVGLSDVENIVYFDESKGHFEWDKTGFYAPEEPGK